jgi:hypothetical protein
VGQLLAALLAIAVGCLEFFVIKTLAFDIQLETEGRGPTALGDGKSLQRILDRKELVCGKVGSKTRQQISNLVDKWKKFSTDRYNSRVLLKFGVPVNPSDKDTPRDCEADPPAKE